MKKICLSIILAISSMNVSIGCDCIMTPLENHIENISLILRVRVIQILDTKEERENYLLQEFQIEENIGYRANLEVVANLKGTFKKGDLINLSSTFSNCEFKYKIGQEYLLFLRRDNNEIFLETCSYSEPITDKCKSKKYYKKIVRKLKRRN